MTIPRSILVDYLIGYNQRLQIFFRHFTPLVLLYVGVQALVLVHVFQIIRAYWDFYNKMGHKQIFGLILMAKNVTLQLLAIGSLACSWYYLIYAEQKKPENVVIAVSFQALLFGLWVQAFRMYGAFLVALLAIECIIIKGWQVTSLGWQVLQGNEVTGFYPVGLYALHFFDAAACLFQLWRYRANRWLMATRLDLNLIILICVFVLNHRVQLSGDSWISLKPNQLTAFMYLLMIFSASTSLVMLGFTSQKIRFRRKKKAKGKGKESEQRQKETELGSQPPALKKQDKSEETLNLLPLESSVLAGSNSTQSVKSEDINF